MSGSKQDILSMNNLQGNRDDQDANNNLNQLKDDQKSKNKKVELELQQKNKQQQVLDKQDSIQKIETSQAQNLRKLVSGQKDLLLVNNLIQTSKYTLITFLPKNMMEQFSKPPNVYFLILGLLQMIQSISISSGTPTIYFPLVVILIITGLKDLWEDMKRKKSDNEENNRMVEVWEQNEFVLRSWKELRVGDIVKVKDRQYFPADLLLLSSSEKNGQCFIETKNLDGETNLKVKQTQKSIYNIFSASNPDFTKSKIEFLFDAPHHNLHQFNGRVQYQTDEMIPINFENFILRGCSLKNSAYIYGLVTYTGSETKIMLNSIAAQPKRSMVDIKMGRQVLMIFVIQLVFCFFSGMFYSLWYIKYKNNLGYLYIKENSADDLPVTNFFLKFGNWLLIFGNFVPISLLVTMEFVKLFQAIFISKDKKMTYYFKDENTNQDQFTDTAVQSSNLNEELGQVEYIFSDKTGTLTRNIMDFKNVVIFGKSYGEKESYCQEMEKMAKISNVDFNDENIFKYYQGQLDEKEHNNILDFLLYLGLCHTVTIEKNEDQEISYSASSPDELALLNFARYLGVTYAGIDDKDIITLQVENTKDNRKVQLMRFELLQIFQFNSDRKRQSVIVRNVENDQIILYCKGADSVIKKITNEEKSFFVKETNNYLNEYSKIGLRTLLLAKKELSLKEYQDWNEEYKKAKVSMTDRDKKIASLQSDMEQNLILVGATAIEDKLQDKVGDTIAALKAAGIKVWVLTGDKVETAKNIGKSCRLIQDGMTLHEVNTDSEEKLTHKQEEDLVISQLDAICKTLKIFEEDEDSEKTQSKNIKQILPQDDLIKIQQQNALVITGEALIHGLQPKISKKIVNISKFCNSVLACRVSPKQKADIVKLIRHNKTDSVTLAIGDGANDVNMISAAHVGVGIKGLEGQQASRAADYAIGEFKILRRLLFYHGREAYRRNSRLVCFNFYKNILIVLPQFWYAFNNAFSGVSLYDAYLYQIYNLVYTSIPIILYAIFDEELSPEILTQNQINYYIDGIQHKLYNNLVFWGWFIQGTWQSFIISAFSFQSMEQTFVSEQGYDGHFWMSGTMVFGITQTIANLKVITISSDHSPGSLTLNILSMFVFLLSLFILDKLPSSPAYNIVDQMLGSANFHWGNIIILGAVSFIDFAIEINLKFKTNYTRYTSYKESIEDQIIKTENEKSNEIAQQNLNQRIYLHDKE